jgi:hypothetical protein
MFGADIFGEHRILTVRCFCSDLPRPLIPNGLGFQWRASLLLQISAGT